MSCKLRIIHINDVYILENLPSLTTLIREKSEGPDCTIAVLAGDFVAPSLLSALDLGFGMVDMLLRAGIRYVCFGNHETDIPMDSLFKRIEEFQAGGGVWLNTNMPDFPFPLPEHHILEIASQGQERKIGLIGLLCNYKTIFAQGAFSGAAPSKESVNDAAVRFHKKLHDEEDVDLVLPLTHQDVEDDRVLSGMTIEDGKTPLFPVVLGGHDHEVFIEELDNGSWVIKAGSDAHKTAIIDVTWESQDSTVPQVTVDLVDTKNWAADPEVKAVAERHEAVLSALDSAIIYRHPKDAPLLSSKNVKIGESTIAKLLCTAVRESLSFSTPTDPVDCTLLQAGMIRGKKDYPEGHFTLASLRLEFPAAKEVTVVPMPGRVIAAALKDTRAGEGEVGSSRYLQTCDNIVVAPRGESVVSIGGLPFESDKMYTVAIPVSYTHLTLPTIA